jgi:hypothetical protein
MTVPCPGGFWAKSSGACSNIWHFDELCLLINGERGWPWRAVDDAGEILDMLVQRRLSALAAKGLLSQALERTTDCAVRHRDRSAGELHGGESHLKRWPISISAVVNERHRMRRPRQIVLDALYCSHEADPSATTSARVRPLAAFQMHPKSTAPGIVRTLNGLHTTSGQAGNARTIAPGSQASSLVGSTSRENDTGPSGAKWDRAAIVEVAEQTGHPAAVRARGRELPQLAPALLPASRLAGAPCLVHSFDWRHQCGTSV